MTNFCCGIDFGTTNSSAALAFNNQPPFLINLENDKNTIPTAMFFAENNHISFGREAMDFYMLGEQGRCLRSIKRILGTSLMKSTTNINGKSVLFSDILKCFIMHLKQQIDATAQADVPYVMMGRPVHFRDNDHAGDKQAQEELLMAARACGFLQVAFQFEPIAAAFAHEIHIEGEKLALVIDIGGGTSDFSIIRLGQKLTQKDNRQDDILSATGVRVGGNDFDKELVLKSFMPELGMYSTYGDKRLFVPTSQYFELSEWSSVNSLYSYANKRIMQEVLTTAHNPQKYARLLEVAEKEKGHNLLSLVEEAKIALTVDNQHQTALSFLSGKPQIVIERSDFEAAIEPENAKIKQAIGDCLLAAQTTPKQIELIILTGGSTEVPKVQQLVRQMFPTALISQENKLASVGLGLAYDAKRKFA